MPTINEIADQWVLFAAVLALGFVAGWFARHLLPSIGKKPVINTLYDVHGKFRVDEVEVFTKMRFITGQIDQMRAAAEAQQLAEKLTAEKMNELYDYVEWNFFSGEIPEKLEGVSGAVRKLESKGEVVQLIG
jgi:hypothetical protein